MNEAMQQVARLARVQDADLTGLEQGPAARALLAALVTEPIERVESTGLAEPTGRVPAPPRRTWPVRRLALAACAVGAMTAALVVGPSLLNGPGGATSYANSAIEVTREDGQFVARIKDPLADHAAYAEAFRALGKDVDIQLVPVAPDRVGQLLEAGSGGLFGEVRTELVSSGPAPVDCALQPARCTMIVRISDDTNGPVSYRLGRAARPGETLHDPLASPDAPPPPVRPGDGTGN